MTYYIFVENEKINGAGQCRILNEEIINLEVDEILYNAFIGNPDMYIWDGSDVVVNPNYEEEQAQKERERLNLLSMTRSDFFDGMIMAFGLDSKELRVIVENVLGSINITPIQIRVALNNYDNALNFYRKHTLFTLINNVQIPINETMYLLFTDDIWDKFFETKDYTELQKAIHEVEPANEEKGIE